MLESMNAERNGKMTIKWHLEAYHISFRNISKSCASVTIHIIEKCSFRIYITCSCFSLKSLLYHYIRLLTAIGNSCFGFRSMSFRMVSPQLHFTTLLSPINSDWVVLRLPLVALTRIDLKYCSGQSIGIAPTWAINVSGNITKVSIVWVIALSNRSSKQKLVYSMI